MPDVIALLPDHVANQIAAGEVVQRPASVVKELLENAIDAQATTIQLIIHDAGKQRIQVVDNGVGMSPTDARLAFERHATSKIKQADDLFALHTKGFRGEALASIAAVAQVELQTKRVDDELATKIDMASSEIADQSFVVGPDGTSMVVTNLFYNVPARRNFLKSNTVEMRHIIDEFHRVALGHPSIGFQLIQGKTELFDLPSATLKRRILHIFGSKLEDKLVPVDEETPVANIRGFVLKPEAARRTRGMQFFFVNDRFVKSSFMHHAIKTAFDGLLVDGSHPGYFLAIDLDPQTIDINIHPTKTEVKFENEQSLFAILRSTIKHSLGIFQVAPTLDFEHDPNLDVPYAQNDQVVNRPQIDVDRNFNPFKDTPIPSGGRTNSAQWEALYQEVGSTASDAPELFNGTEELPTATEAKMFQIMQRYIVSATGNALLLIDQERAHQRVLYESFLANITHSNAASQQLLFPLTLSLTALQKALFATYLPFLKEVGFDFGGSLSEDSIPDEVSIIGVPSQCDQSKAIHVFEDLFLTLESDQPTEAFSPSDLLAKSLSRSLSIKSGQSLQDPEQAALVNNLFACKDTLVSPFNRKIFVSLTKEELQKKFS